MNNDQPGTAIATAPQPFSDVPASQNSRAVFLPRDLAQAMELAKYMSGGIGVRNWMRGNPSACLAVIQISMRWGLDPYIVANKAYYANDTLSFESQLVNAVINTCGELIGRLKVTFSGDASGAKQQETLVCKVEGRIRADPDQVFEHEQALKTVKIRNSPLWEVNPKQQLQYHTTRAWARLYLPEVLLGIYAADEIADGAAARMEADATPRGGTAPDRRDFVDNQPEDADFTPVEEKDDTPAAEQEPTTDAQADEATPETDSTVSDAGSRPEDASGGDVQHDSGVDQSAAAVDADTPKPKKMSWRDWEAATTAEIDECASREALDRLRSRIQPALDTASDALMGRIQDRLADKLIVLPE